MRAHGLGIAVALAAAACAPTPATTPGAGGSGGAAGGPDASTGGGAGAAAVGGGGASGPAGAGGVAGATGVAGAGGFAGASGGASAGASGDASAGASGDASAGASGGASAGASGDASTAPDRPGATDAGSDAGADAGADGPTLPPVLPVPTADQVAWQRLGLTAFFHFGMNTFTGDEVGDGTASPSVFNPAGLDPGQWISTLQAAGFKQGTLVVKHHDGFCLWPTKCTSYSVAQSPWMGGKGDVVKAYTDAAHAAGFRVGLYLSPLDNHAADSSSGAGYPAKFTCMLNEILTGYGPVDELWFDGNGAPGIDWTGIYATVRQRQPHTLIAITGPDIRWVGTEDGNAPTGETSVETGMPSLGQPSGPVWFPSESDVSIRPGWFYHPSEDAQLKSLPALTDIFFNTVGHNSVLILNVPPNTSGVLAAPDVARLGQLGSALRSQFATNLAAGRSVTADSSMPGGSYAADRALDGNLDTFWAAAPGATSGRLEVDLGASRTIAVVDVSEPIAFGERAKKYHVEVQAAGGTTWTTVAAGTVIGERNLIRLAPAASARKLALVIEQARGAPAIAELAAY